MPNVVNIEWSEVFRMARFVAETIDLHRQGHVGLYGVPNGGVYAVMAVHQQCPGSYMVEQPEFADVIIDDLIDSGKTKKDYLQRYPNAEFYALIEKDPRLGDWISFPWERMKGETGPEDAVIRLIEYAGDDPHREGLLETPRRVVRAFDEIFAGYRADPKDVLKCFDVAYDEMVVLKDVEFFSTCEHHMLPFFGSGHVAYIPDGKVIGVSKLARLLDIFARRLQVQERLCQQVTTFLMEELQPLGAACVLEARHLCMSCRGAAKQHSKMITSSLEGVFRKQEVRQEFFNMIGRK